MNAPITEEDMPAIRSMIHKLKRYRRREHAQNKRYITELDDAINALIEYGQLKGWWKDEH